MKFSIAIPAYENEKALERALNSIAKQSYKNIEIIVSDDCSKKSNLKKICEDFKKKIQNYCYIIIIRKEIYHPR